MGKPTGFLEHQRAAARYRPVAERIGDYGEIGIPLSRGECAVQGSRCMDCGIPYCHAVGCPLYNLIPEWNDCVYRGDWHEALLRLEATNNFPEFTGRVCPAPCEAACTLAVNSAPVTIKQLELAIIENGFSLGQVVPRPPRNDSGKNIAVIGSGPAGLAAAQELRRAGHRVTVFERSAKAGGILRYGIPDFKLDKGILDRRLRQMAEEGVAFETGVAAGDDISGRYLRRTFDAVLLATGAGEPRDLKVPGRGLEGIHFAMEYLTQANRNVSGEARLEKTISARDRSVLVIGGGDTGSDCVGTAIRQGAKKVYQFEILPQPREWNGTTNPEWPSWPNILRTSSSHEEGCERGWGILTKEFGGRDVKLTEGFFTRVAWETEPGSGRKKMAEVPGSGFTLSLDLVLLAMGFLHTEHSRLTDELGVEFDDNGNIRCSGGCATSSEGVFAAGDAATGASLVVRAIHHGREAAQEINTYLQG